eukprot:scaffold84315_cov34-Prasinocladus_malaysianus.AAC.3
MAKEDKNGDHRDGKGGKYSKIRHKKVREKEAGEIDGPDFMKQNYHAQCNLVRMGAGIAGGWRARVRCRAVVVNITQTWFAGHLQPAERSFEKICPTPTPHLSNPYHNG